MTSGHSASGRTNTDLTLPPVGSDQIPLSGAIGRLIRLAMGIAALVLVAVVAGSISIPWQVTVAASGSLEPTDIWPIRSPVGGVVTELRVATGDTVKPGQLLALLDAALIEADLNRLRRELAHERGQVSLDSSLAVQEGLAAESNVARALANVLRARANLREELANRGVAGDLDSLRSHLRVGQSVALDRALADLSVAETDLRESEARDVTASATGRSQARQHEIAQLESQIAQAIGALDRTRLLSTHSGIVISEGMDRLRGASIQAGEVLFELSSLTAWRAKLIVGESDAYRVQAGDSVSVEIPSLAGASIDRVRGVVERIGTEPVSSGTTGYPVTVRLPSVLPAEWQPALRRGLSLRTRIVVGRTTVLEWWRKQIG